MSPHYPAQNLSVQIQLRSEHGKDIIKCNFTLKYVFRLTFLSGAKGERENTYCCFTLTLIASFSSVTNASIAVAMASSRVTCSLRLLLSEAEQVTESGVAAMALPRAATLVFVFPLPASLESSVLVLITSAQEAGVEISLLCLGTI